MATFGRSPKSARADTEAEERIRSFLFDEELSKSEATALRQVGGGTTRDLLARLVLTRVEGVFHRALAIAEKEPGEVEVIVRLGIPGTLTAGRAEGSRLQATLPRRVPAWTIVVTDEAAHEHALQELHSRARVERRSFELLERARSLAVRMEDRLVHVCAADDLVAHLERVMVRGPRPVTTASSEESGAARPSLVGALLGKKYLLTKFLGSGGFGTVYEAVDVLLESRVAVKVVDREASAEHLWHFKQEAKRVTRLYHPNVVGWKTFEETEDGKCYFVMELLEGRDLRQVVETDGPLTPRAAIPIAAQVLSALRAAHAARSPEPILHLDLKPENVLLVDDPEHPSKKMAKVIDFGISQLVRGAATLPRVEPGVAAEDGTGGIAKVTGCSPEYAAPEHCALMLGTSTVPLDGRADIYSLGVLLHYLLTGTLPFPTLPDRRELMWMKQGGTARLDASLDRRIPTKLGTFIERCLATDRAERWASADDALKELDLIAQAPRRRAVLAASIVLPLAVFGLVRSLAGARQPPEVFERLPGGDVSLRSRSLYLGPERQQALLRVDGLRSKERAKDVRLLARRSPDEPAPAGLSLAWAEGGEMALSARLPAGRQSSPVYVAFEDGSDELTCAEPFELVWLGHGAVVLTEVALPAHAATWDAHLLAASLRVTGLAEDIARVWVETDVGARDATLESRDPESRSLLYSVLLDELLAGEGRTSVTGFVQDNAGRVQSSGLVAEVLSRPLQFASVTFARSTSQEPAILTEDAPRALGLGLNSKADVRWALETAAGTLRTGMWPAVLSGEHELEGVDSFFADEPFSGHVTLEASDAAYVHRAAPERGRAVRRVPFRYVPGGPAIELRLIEEGSEERDVAEHEGWRYTNAERLRLSVMRRTEAPLLLRPKLAAVARAETERTLPQRALLDPLVLGASWEIELAHEGRYSLSVDAWHHVAGIETAAPEAAVHVVEEIVVDRTRPTLALLSADALILRASALEPSFSVSIGDAGQLGLPSVTLDWSLFDVDGGNELVTTGSFGRHGERADLSIPLASRDLGQQLPGERDGRYRLVLMGTDPAGNGSDPVSLDFAYSAAGPRLRVLEPLDGTTVLPRSNTLVLRALATDGNGIESITARASLEGLEFGTQLALRGDELWEAAVPVPIEWAGKGFDLVLTAVDTCGSETRTSAKLALAALHEWAPEVVTSAQASRPAHTLSLVRGNLGYSYVFGGRSDEEENDRFRVAGLKPFNDLWISRAWRIAYPSGSIADFYLDVDEVRNAAFREFLAADEAWTDPALWPGSLPDPQRREALTTRLARAPDDEPVTGVTWDEATAYARWMGMRLPSIVEWEFAVRGGLLYRPHADWERDSLDERGDGSLRGLSSGVAEWTGSPGSFLPGAELPVDLAAHLLEFKAGLLDPSASASGDSAACYWAAGSPGTLADFSMMSARPRGWADAGTGFRCAMDAAALLAPAPQRDEAAK